MRLDLELLCRKLQARLKSPPARYAEGSSLWQAGSPPPPPARRARKTCSDEEYGVMIPRATARLTASAGPTFCVRSRPRKRFELTPPRPSCIHSVVPDHSSRIVYPGSARFRKSTATVGYLCARTLDSRILQRWNGALVRHLHQWSALSSDVATKARKKQRNA